MAYSVRFRPAAERDLKNLPAEILERIDLRVLDLARDPRPPGSKKLKGREDSWRLRVGDWRVIYTVEDSEKLVVIGRVLHRGKAYR